MTATKMPGSMAEVHRALSSELHFLYTKWNAWQRLYSTDAETVKVLEQTAEGFFWVNREVLRDDILLTLCRLTDPAKARCTSRDNCTFAKHLNGIPLADNTLRDAVQKKLSAFGPKVEPARLHRNRRIAHSDLFTKMKRPEPLLPDLPTADVEDVLAGMADILNSIALHYDDHEYLYRDGIHMSGDADHLVQALAEYQRWRKQKYLGDG